MLDFVNNFWNENRNLCKPDLICLRQDADNYKTLLFQPNGKIAFNNGGIWLDDKNLANDKFEKFIDLAINQNVELAITPEYSCPWPVIENIINLNKLPDEHRIWIMGCQSIKAQELDDLINRHPHIEWIYENNLVNNNKTNSKFFDPVCICFKTKNAVGELKTVIVVQFKSMFFAGRDFKWERDNSIRGEKIYVIENQVASTKLVTLICSDTLQKNPMLNFNEIQDGCFFDSPLLLIHIQLNRKPLDTTYKIYRDLIFTDGRIESHKKEVITLNWARHVKYDSSGIEDIFNEYGGSGFYIKSHMLNKEDSRFNENHYSGLYCTNWEEKLSHIYMLNYDEFVFLIENTKPSQERADPRQQERTGPKCLLTYSWQNSNWTSTTDINDGFVDFCRSIQSQVGNLSCIMSNRNPINVERIVELTTGNFNYYDPLWYTLDNLISVKIQNDEICKRTNFTHEPDPTSVTERDKKITQYSRLKNNILPNPALMPKPTLNFELKYDLTKNTSDKYLLNLCSTTDKTEWTGVYLGDTTKSKAQIYLDNISNLFKENQSSRLTIVWYFDGNNYQNINNLQAPPDIRDNSSNQINSITSSQKL